VRRSGFGALLDGLAARRPAAPAALLPTLLPAFILPAPTTLASMLATTLVLGSSPFCSLL